MIIRPFEENDVAAVAALWQYWFKDKTLEPTEALIDLARRIYVQAPTRDDEVPSLVAEGDDGKVLGFLGASVVPAMVDGREGKLAGVFPSVVHPEAPAAVATFLLRRFLAGSQDFSFSDGGHVKFEPIWEALGGQIAQLQSLRWVKLLRPAELGVSRSRGNLSKYLSYLLRPVARGADLVVRQVNPRFFRGVPSHRDSRGSRDMDSTHFTTVDLRPTVLVELADRLHAKARLRPIYSGAYVTWLFREMARIGSLGEFTAKGVIGPSGEAVGWFIYYMQPGGVSRVFDIDGDSRYLSAVVDHLVIDADSRGAGALIGRMEPRLRRVLAHHTELVVSSGSLQMVHSKDESLMDNAQLGRLAFSRLQGENWYWWALDAVPAT